MKYQIRLRLVGAALILAVGLLVAALELNAEYRAHEIQLWPIAKARVDFADFKFGCDRNGNFSLEIQYTYTYSDKEFRSKLINPNYLYCGPNPEKSKAYQEYSLGSSIFIRVNPADNAESVLDEKFDFDFSKKLLLIETLVTLGGLASVIFYSRRLKKFM